MIIKGNEIETNVPCDIEQINKKVTMISPNQPVKIHIVPLFSECFGSESKSRSFASKGSSQSIERRMDSDMASFSSKNSIYWQMISELGKTYCLSDINMSLCKQNLSADKSHGSSERKHTNMDAMMQSNIQHFIKESFNMSSLLKDSSSNNKASSSQQ